MNKLLLFTVLVLAISVPPLCAQDGCINSPENPTAVLACIGGGVFAVRAKIRSRKSTKK